MNKYLTPQQEYEIECAIYNDNHKALLEMFPETLEESIPEEVIKELADGQRYCFLGDSDVMLREDGRLFNAKYIRTIKAVYCAKDILAIIKYTQYRFSEVYKQQGWHFDQAQIVRTYKDNGWKMTVSKQYQTHYEEL